MEGFDETSGSVGSISGPVVLLVTADQSLRTEVSEAINRQEEMQLLLASNGDSAVERVADERIDCVVADLAALGDECGEFIKDVRKISGQCPIILLAGRSPVDLESGLVESATTIVEKGRDGDISHFLVQKIQGAIRDSTTEEQDDDLYKMLVETARDGLYRLNANGDFTYLNDSFADMLGYDRHDLLGAHSSRVMAPGELERGQQLIQRTLEADERESDIMDMEMVTKTGKRRIGSLHFVVLTTEDGAYDGVMGVMRDITERKRHEEELHNRSKALQQLHEATTDLYAAETFADCFDSTIEAGVEILGFDWCTLAAPAPEGELFEIIAVSEDAPLEAGDRPFGTDEGVAGHVYQTKTARIDDDVQEETESKPTDDAIRSALTIPVGDWGVFQAVATTPGVFDEQDQTHAEILGTALAAAIDRLEREAELRARQTELQRQNERLEKFTDFVSHDLRNPLNVAEGRLELAQSESPNEHHAEIRRAHERMRSLIDDLLTLAREGERDTEYESIDLAEIATNCWRNVEGTGARLHMDSAPTIRADRDRLQQMLENLFRNAVEHGGESVTIWLGQLDGKSGFYVADDGEGIPPDIRDEIFESGYSTAAEGTGIGLSIVQEVADAHGWEVKSTASEQDGARFEISGVEIVE